MSLCFARKRVVKLQTRERVITKMLIVNDMGETQSVNEKEVKGKVLVRGEFSNIFYVFESDTPFEQVKCRLEGLFPHKKLAHFQNEDNMLTSPLFLEAGKYVLL